MIEATTNPHARTAITKAHSERAEVIRAAWAWLFGNAPH